MFLGDAGSEDPEVTSGQPVPGLQPELNGGRPGSTAILADGVNNTGVGIARAIVSFTPETVQEFTVQTSAFDAQFGKTGGGVINVTTKSGTNDYKGVVITLSPESCYECQKMDNLNVASAQQLSLYARVIDLGRSGVFAALW